MEAFHNDIKVKNKYLKRVEAHQKADEFIKGSYWDEDEHRGCAVGCTIHGSDHSAYDAAAAASAAASAYARFSSRQKDRKKTWSKFAAKILELIRDQAALAVAKEKK